MRLQALQEIKHILCLHEIDTTGCRHTAGGHHRWATSPRPQGRAHQVQQEGPTHGLAEGLQREMEGRGGSEYV